MTAYEAKNKFQHLKKKFESHNYSLMQKNKAKIKKLRNEFFNFPNRLILNLQYEQSEQQLYGFESTLTDGLHPDRSNELHPDRS